MNNKISFSNRLRKFVDGEANTPFEYFMFLIVVINTVSIGLETSPSFFEK